MKKNNPNTPIMIREALGVNPRVFARYEYGKEKSESLSGQNPLHRHWRNVTNSAKGLNDKEIEERVTGLVKSNIAYSS
ncbi:hypothetical protein MMC25_005183 [Agyrium rufum]|nr:hypothetical protein [Agyrium rufum]